MKCIFKLAFLFSLLLAKNGKAQTYIPLLENVNKWAIFSVLPGVERSFFSNSGYFNATDTIIDSMAYKWIKPDANFLYLPGDSLQYFLREDTSNRLVYIRYSDTISDFLLYNFNLFQGDSIYLEFKTNNFSNGYFYIDSTGVLNTLSGIRKTWHLSNTLNQKIVWIEGIGSIYGPVYTADMYCDLCIYTYCMNQIGTNVFLTCAFKDSVQLYQNTICDIPPVWMAIQYTNCLYMGAGGFEDVANASFVDLYPNPANNFLNIKVKQMEGLFNLKIIDAKGVVVKKIKLIDKIVNNEIKIDIASLPVGLYVILDEMGNSGKFIKE